MFARLPGASRQPHKPTMMSLNTTTSTMLVVVVAVVCVVVVVVAVAVEHDNAMKINQATCCASGQTTKTTNHQFFTSTRALKLASANY